jgi:uncharacterized YkwD family protein
MFFLLLSFLFAAFNVTGVSAGTPQVALTADEQQMVELINRHRVAVGLQPFQVDMILTQVARLKTQDMLEQGYFAHQSPTYGSPFEMIRAAGLQYRYAGETLAMAPSVEAAFSAVKSGRNVLSDKFDRIGIGIAARGSSRVFTLLFTGGQKSVSWQLNLQPAPQPVIQPVPQQPQPEPVPLNDGLSADERQMLNLVNQERVAAGRQPLQVDMALVKLARLKAQDMIDKGYFDHQSPTYGSPFEMIQAAGIEYRYAGENLAGAPTVNSAHENLMNSSGHRANILNANYTKTGIGIVDGGPYGKMFVQLFTG